MLQTLFFSLYRIGYLFKFINSVPGRFRYFNFRIIIRSEIVYFGEIGFAFPRGDLSIAYLPQEILQKFLPVQIVQVIVLLIPIIILAVFIVIIVVIFTGII